MLLNEIAPFDDNEEDTSPAAAAAARARIRNNAARARRDAIRHGAGIPLTSTQIKAIAADKSSKTNAPRASEQDELIADEVKELVTQAYTNVRVFKNYNKRDITIKVGNVHIRDKVSKSVGALNNTLRTKYGIEPVELGSSTVIYHIPYTV